MLRLVCSNHQCPSTLEALEFEIAFCSAQHEGRKSKTEDYIAITDLVKDLNNKIKEWNKKNTWDGK